MSFIQPLLIASFVLLALVSCSEPSIPELKWHVIHVSGDHSSGDAHLLELPNGQSVLIDTGYEVFADYALLPYLQNLGLQKLDLVVVTHAHKNHYGGLLKLHQQIDIKTLAFTAPAAEICAKEKKGDRCNLSHANRVRTQVGQRAIVIDTNNGQTLLLDKKNQVRLAVLHQVLSHSDPIYQSFWQNTMRFTVNESSAVLKLEFGDQSILFPGDIGPATGAFLAGHARTGLKSTLLAAPHHGVTPLPSKRFFEAVSPKAIIASISNPPFDSDRGEPLRAFARDGGIPLYVTGKTGSLLVTLRHHDFTIQSER